MIAITSHKEIVCKIVRDIVDEYLKHNFESKEPFNMCISITNLDGNTSDTIMVLLRWFGFDVTFNQKLVDNQLVEDDSVFLITKEKVYL